ncbi:MAG: hypothetical protein GF334_02590 [Candidatus Altiarchaeales archaeon]|nr:hypothetical protein [Candidatus Altiarchaeales archaeon]
MLHPHEIEDPLLLQEKIRSYERLGQYDLIPEVLKALIDLEKWEMARDYITSISFSGRPLYTCECTKYYSRIPECSLCSTTPKLVREHNPHVGRVAANLSRDFLEACLGIYTIDGKKDLIRILVDAYFVGARYWFDLKTEEEWREWGKGWFKDRFKGQPVFVEMYNCNIIYLRFGSGSGREENRNRAAVHFGGPTLVHSGEIPPLPHLPESRGWRGESKKAP